MTLLFLGSDGCFLSSSIGHYCIDTTGHVGTFTPRPAKTTTSQTHVCLGTPKRQHNVAQQTNTSIKENQHHKETEASTNTREHAG